MLRLTESRFTDQSRFGSGCLPHRSQSVVDSFSCQRQSFRRVSWKMAGDCVRNANKYRKIPYSAMVREVKKWSGIRIQDRTSTKNADMEQSATRDSGLLLTSNIPKGDQVSPFSSVIQLSWRCPLWRSADVCIELCNSLDVVFVKFPLQLCDGSTIIHDICSSISSSTIGRPNHNTKL